MMKRDAGKRMESENKGKIKKSNKFIQFYMKWSKKLSKSVIF